MSAAAMTLLERSFADALVKVTGYEPRRVGDEWKGLCPAHGDRTPSLDFHEEGGTLLVFCRSRNCDGREIFKAADFRLPRLPASRPIRARYPYTDESGRELAVKIRFDDGHDPKCTFTKKLDGRKLPLYRSPDILAAKREGRPIHVTEGEKDADTLRDLGLVGTSAPYGAVTGAGKWTEAHTATLAGCDVTLHQDADAAGAEHVGNLVRLLAGRVKSLRIVPPYPGPEGCDVSDFLAAHGRGATLTHIAKAEAAAEPERPDLTETGNSLRFAERFRDRLRYVPDFDAYLVFENGRLVLDVGGVRTLEMTRSVTREMRASNDMHVAAFGVKSERRSARENMRVLAQSLPGLAVSPSELDADPWALSCPNGLLDLRTGNLREARLEDLVTKQTSVPYIAGATAPRWRRFLCEVTCGDAELESFLQRATGYSLTGRTGEQVFFFLYGDGANGKGTFVKVLQRTLGDYAAVLKTEALMAQYGQAHPTELVPLLGARFVTANEVPDGRSWNESRLKELTGEDRLTARRMHENFWTFEPTHKLWISGNYRPRVHGDDFGMWRRVRLVPFSARFDVNPRLFEELLAEAEGVLAWAVEGCLAWQRDGLGLPAKVKAATAAYQERENVVGQFVAEACHQNPQADTSTAVLYGGFVRWCEKAGERPAAKRGFSERIERLGFERNEDKNARGFKRIGLKKEWLFAGEL